MSGKKDITSCSIMINSKDPEQQSLSIYPKILLLSHHSPSLKIWSLSSNWAGLFARFGIYLMYFQMQIFARVTTCLERMVFTIQLFLIFQSPSEILPTPRSLSDFSYIPVSGICQFCRPFLQESVSSADPSLSSSHDLAYTPLCCLLIHWCIYQLFI